MGQAKAVTGKCCIRVEAMKFHALAEAVRIETMGLPVFEKVPFYAGFRKLGYVPANEWVEANEAKSG